MKKARIILVILILILGIQFTYSRFITSKPNGNVQATIGRAIVDIDFAATPNSTGNNIDGSNKIHLESSDDIMKTNFQVKNYKNGVISDVDLKFNIYVVYENATIRSELDCDIGDSSFEVADTNDVRYFTKTKLTSTATITVSGSQVTLPVGTYKFTSNEVLTGSQSSTSRIYNVLTYLKENCNPFAEDDCGIKIYCVAEQNV